jgi:hypothetical protein
VSTGGRQSNYSIGYNGRKNYVRKLKPTPVFLEKIKECAENKSKLAPELNQGTSDYELDAHTDFCSLFVSG